MNPKLSFFLLIGIVTALFGCGKSAEGKAGMADTPIAAAAQMQEAFSQADPQMKQLATVTSEALRKNQYMEAVASLQALRANDAVTDDQRLAIYSSRVSLEARLISAIEAGDKNAERAYQMLKAMKRD